MITLKVIGLGVIISYGIACLMKLTMVCILEIQQERGGRREMSILDLFQGIGTMFAQSPQIAIARVALIFLGFLLVYLGVKGTLEPLIMVPMGLGMSAVNAGVLFLGENQIGNLIIDPLLSTTDELMTYMQINFLQRFII